MAKGFGEVRPELVGGAGGALEMEPLFPLFLQNFLILFTLMRAVFPFWAPLAPLPSSEAIESTENRLEGVCDEVRLRSDGTNSDEPRARNEKKRSYM